MRQLLCRDVVKLNVPAADPPKGKIVQVYMQINIPCKGNHKVIACSFAVHDNHARIQHVHVCIILFLISTANVPHLVKMAYTGRKPLVEIAPPKTQLL